MHADEHKSHPHCLSAWVPSSLSRDLGLMEKWPKKWLQETSPCFLHLSKRKRKKKYPNQRVALGYFRKAFPFTILMEKPQLASTLSLRGNSQYPFSWVSKADPFLLHPVHWSMGYYCIFNMYHNYCSPAAGCMPIQTRNFLRQHHITSSIQPEVNQFGEIHKHKQKTQAGEHSSSDLNTFVTK